MPALPAPPAVSAAPCTTQLALSVRPGKAANARVLALRNAGATACRLLALPRLVFRDRAGAALPIERANPFRRHDGAPSLGHGPVIPSITLSAGGTATITLSWSATGPVCFAVRAVTLAPQGAPPADVDGTGVPFDATVCGATTDYLEVRQGWVAVEG